MAQSELASFDLNLLRSLHTLLTLQHVSNAADAMDMTQSAMSKNLSRLRQHFQDQLLVRTGNSMVLTPKAQQLIEPVAGVLHSVDGMLAQPVFDPGTHPMRFRVVAADFLMQLYFPGFLGFVLQKAPQLKMDLVAWSGESLTQMANGQVDFLFGGLLDAPAGVYRKILNTSRYVCISRKGHNGLKQGFNLQGYLAAGHVSITLLGSGSNPVDDWLAQQGLKRNVVVTTPYFMSGVAIVSESDLLMITHAGLAAQAQQQFPLDIHELPVQPPMPPFGLYWHERTAKSQEHLWFREQVVESMSGWGNS